jgi:tRNA modification GTPase
LASIAADLRQQGINHLLVGNKIDRSDEAQMRRKFSATEGIMFISAKSGFRLEVLRERMVDLVLKDSVSTENVIVTNARHYHALVQVNDALNDVMQGLENKIPGDLLALDIRRSLQYLGEITGEITNEDQLDYIFSKFCIGK